jgi:hypothetical protein
MQKKMPVAMLVQRRRLSAIKQQLEVGLSAVLGASCVWQKTQDEKRDAEDHRQEKVSPGNRRGSWMGYFKLLARSGCDDMALVNALSSAAGVDSPD